MQYEQKIEELSKPKAKPEEKPEAKLEVKPEAKLEAKPEAKPEVKPEVKLEVKPEVKAQEAKPADIKTKQEETKTPDRKTQTNTKTLDTTAEEAAKEPQGFLAKAKAAQAKVTVVTETISSYLNVPCIHNSICLFELLAS